MLLRTLHRRPLCQHKFCCNFFHFKSLFAWTIHRHWGQGAGALPPYTPVPFIWWHGVGFLAKRGCDEDSLPACGHKPRSSRAQPQRYSSWRRRRGRRVLCRHAAHQVERPGGTGVASQEDAILPEKTTNTCSVTYLILCVDRRTDKNPKAVRIHSNSTHTLTHTHNRQRRGEDVSSSAERTCHIIKWWPVMETDGSPAVKRPFEVWVKLPGLPC